MNILVTGANGFIGSHLVHKLKAENRILCLIHNESMGKWLKEALEGTVLVRGDVRDHPLIKEVMARYHIQHVYHLAAIAQVKTAYKDPLSVYDINVMGTVSLLEACRQLEVEKILIMETDKCYGERLNADENSPLEASEPYATSKIAQQLISESYRRTYGMDIVLPHAPNTFGYDPYSNRIFPNTIKACLRGESPLIFTNDKSIREYIYIDDLVNALKTMMFSLEYPRYRGSYNIPTGWVYNQEDIVLKVLEHFPSIKPKYIDAELPSQIQRQTMKSVKWNWKPKWSFDEAVGETIMKFKEYESDWK